MRYFMSGERLAALLVAEGIIDEKAVSDSGWYDSGEILDGIYRLAARLQNEN